MANEYAYIKKQDKKVFEAITGEEKREAEGLELIPSENYVSRAVREANGSIFTNKYSEGYPGKRYYGGQKYTDVIENIAIERACKLFGAKFANVQPHSGAPANIAVYFALLQPGDTVLGMDLSHGGHLTHGHPVTYMAKIFRFVRYKMKNPETGEIDYKALRETAIKEKPKIILAGFSAYSRELDYKKFVDIAREVGAISMMDAAHIAGLIAGKAVKNPLDYGFDIMTTTILAAKAVCFGEAMKPAFKKYAKQILKNAKAMEEVFRKHKIRMLGGGTSNHLILADVYGSLGVSGREAERALDEIGLTLNMNAIADDPRKPMDPSGIRFGTPAITTRGFKEKECREVAEIMIEALKNKDNSKKKKELHARVRKLSKKFPIPDKFV